MKSQQSTNLLSRIEYSGDAGNNGVSGEECKICQLKREKEKRFIPQIKTKSGSEITSVTWDQAELKVTFQKNKFLDYFYSLFIICYYFYD